MAQKIIPVKYFLIGMGVLLLAIAGLFYYLWQKEAGEIKALKERGITTDAWVLSLRAQTSGKKSKSVTYQHYMDVACFADTAATTTVTKDTAVSTAKNGSDLVDKIFNKINADQKPAGDYQTISIPIHGIAFKKYRVDDKVKIVYLKDNPAVARLLEEL